MEPSQDDGFKWFGEGFDGFPKTLPDDTVEYAIYVIDKALNQQRVATRLKAVHRDANELVKELLKDYIWQRDAFALGLEFQHGRWALSGRTNFGDSIADEWLIVYLLRTLSLKNPDVWIRVYDTDGEFLLIEAANSLPRWVKPEIAANRVWIHGGSLKLIPRQASLALDTRAPSLNEAINYIESKQQTMTHSPLIEAEAFFRLNNYPRAIEDQFHHSVIRLPSKVAYLLMKRPAFVSPAVEAFYLRDPISMKILQATGSSERNFVPQDLVEVSVRFTRVGFAQIRSQEFSPPDYWTGVLSDPELSSKDRIRLETGMKLTCGFEMLMKDVKSASKISVREMEILLEDLATEEDPLPDSKALDIWRHRDDEEAWMNIDFNEFDRELSGRNTTTGSGFGDKDAQEQLKKMVSRFEDFLNDDRAGLDGAGLEDDFSTEDDDYDDSDDSDDVSEPKDEGEDREVSFDEVEFARAMREMMGLPPEAATDQAIAPTDQTVDEEMKSIATMSEQIEKELKPTGVLDLSSKSRTNTTALQSGETLFAENEADADHLENEDELDIDFGLAQNMLEAFKSQGGLAGPAGNLMSLLGVSIPPDKD